jgi:predicted phage baseplate assembly protein
MTDTTPCGCCSGTHAETPVTLSNRAGLSSISYRSGTWSQFLSSMLDDLSTHPALSGLSTRSDDDFTIALLDSWAVVCDILTFYQERIANEDYLRTATELISVSELAMLIGYTPRPGLAASTALSFTIDTPLPLPPGPSSPPSGSPPSIVVATGTQAQTVPDPGSQPATFETVADITARAEWNAIRPRMSRPPASNVHNAWSNVRLSGLVTSLKIGDMVLVVAPGASDLKVLNRVVAITMDTSTNTTVVEFEHRQDPQQAPLPTSVASVTPGATLNDSFLWSSIKGHVWPDQGELVAAAVAQNWSLDALGNEIEALRVHRPPSSEPPLRVYAMGIDASLFGHNAVDWMSLSHTLKGIYTDDWNNDTLQTTSGEFTVDLDNTYAAVAGDQVVLLGDNSCAVFPTTVADVTVLTRNAYLMSSKLTRVTLKASPSDPTYFGLRTTRVLVQTAELEVANVISTDHVGGASVLLDGAYLSLSVGQLIVVTGLRADKQSETDSEVVAIQHLSLVDGYTEVTFSPRLSGTYVRDTVTINANAAPATHGVSTSEILGSGDASKAFQSFQLKQPPLTFVSASTPSGAASTLTVRVNGVEWTEVDWLFGAKPTDLVYTVIIGSDGSTMVQFGDGVTGARPGSGTNNIQATYRTGIGTAGQARPGQISTLLSRPLGLKGVTNPIPSSGAANPETIFQAQANAPMTVKTIDRIVSLDDVGDFAAASAGIAKASSSWIWNGANFVACATVAGVGGAAVTPGTDPYANLLQSMQNATDGTLQVALCDYIPKSFTVAATITPDPSLVAATVLADVLNVLSSMFSFASRAFGQPVFASEVISTIQNVPGVIAMTLDGLALDGAVPGATPDALVALAPTLGPHGLQGAELLTIDTGPLPGVVIAS